MGRLSLPRQRVLPAWRAGDRAAQHPELHPDVRRDRDADNRARAHPPEAGTHPVLRTDRFGKVDEHGNAGRRDQQDQAVPHHHDRRSDRVLARESRRGRTSTRSRHRRSLLRRGHCALRSEKTPTSCSSARCATPRASRSRSRWRRPGTSCSRRCTRTTRRRRSTASSTCSRPSGRVRSGLQLASTLTAVVAQRLRAACRRWARRRVRSVCLARTAVSNLIREGKTNQLRNAMQIALRDGHKTLEMSLNELVAVGRHHAGDRSRDRVRPARSRPEPGVTDARDGFVAQGSVDGVSMRPTSDHQTSEPQPGPRRFTRRPAADCCGTRRSDGGSGRRAALARCDERRRRTCRERGRPGGRCQRVEQCRQIPRKRGAAHCRVHRDGRCSKICKRALPRKLGREVSNPMGGPHWLLASPLRVARKHRGQPGEPEGTRRSGLAADHLRRGHRAVVVDMSLGGDGFLTLFIHRACRAQVRAQAPSARGVPSM